jgi:hypothetical protein
MDYQAFRQDHGGLGQWTQPPVFPQLPFFHSFLRMGYKKIVRPNQLPVHPTPGDPSGNCLICQKFRKFHEI